MVEFIVSYSWLLWLGLVLVFVIIEVSTVDFTFLMLAIGSLGGLASGLLGLPVSGQIIVAAVLSVLLLFLVRPWLKRVLERGSDRTPSNVDALLGLTGVVTTEFVDGQGHAKLANGEVWTARLSQSSAQRVVEVGENVIVTAIEGATAMVVPSERIAQ
ncbi:NfeD family protein [Parafrigoribacterium soli]|uniref:NfeD family protein n=1 Tax=Parafrigoribacterium soli TaxID=3144663 RepID=UPI0032EFD5EA